MAEPIEPVGGGDLSLPPKVVGRVSGYLVMKVDEVLWARQPPGEISAAVMWWGEDYPTTFRPVDVSQQDLLRKHTSVIYEIRTSKDLFEKYLQKCGFLKIAVADKYGMPIGCANIPDLHKMLRVSPLQNYFPIINTFGNRIGDLHVSFNLRMTSPGPAVDARSSSEINDSVKSKKAVKRLSDHGGKSIKPANNTHIQENKRRRGMLTSSDEFIKLPLEVNPSKKSMSGPKYLKTFDQCTSTSNLVGEEADIPKAFNGLLHNKNSTATDNMISQILEHGKRIRNAMTHAVIENDIEPQCESKTFNSFSQNLLDIASNDAMTSDCVNVTEYVNGTKKGKQDRSSEKEKKLLEFLAGKPMTESEENEAVEALRNTTPSKEVLEKVNKIVGSSVKLSKFDSECEKDVSKELIAVTTGDVIPHNQTNLKSSFKIDAELLSHVNCLRISVTNLVLNSVGLKRIGSSSACQKKRIKGCTSSQTPPPGVTYFVEYQIPSVSGSRIMSNVVRYCSKKQVGYEVRFGSRSVHNIPALDRSSLVKHSSLESFVLSLTFKVCARHLNQRVPILLGLATPESAMFLLGSTHLRYDYELPVIASDQLPVAKLQICLELGRDRIHFGGLFDPENNSLGAASDKENCEHLVSKTLLQSRNVKETGSTKLKPTVLVTRNVPKSNPEQAARWKKSGSGNRVLKEPEESSKKNMNLFSSKVSPTQSSTPTQCDSAKSQDSLFRPSNLKLNVKGESSKSVQSCLKHELAVTVQQICNCLPLDGTVTGDRECFVSYKFPSWDASLNGIVEWNSFSTEPTVCLQDTWFRPQCRVHSVVLPETLSLHVFLLESFKMRGTASDADFTVMFSVCVREYTEKVKDTLLAQTFLPYSSLVELENAYNSAATGDPRFSDSSCASVVLDLPLHFPPTFERFQSFGNGYLKIKVDYRQVHSKQSSRCSSLSHGREESVPGFPQNRNLGFKEKHFREANMDLFNFESIPNWAKSPDKQRPHPWKNCEAVTNGYFNTCGQGEEETRMGCPPAVQQSAHASWEPVKEMQYKGGVTSKKYDWERQYSSRLSSKAGHASHASVMDLLHVDDYSKKVGSSVDKYRFLSIPNSAHSISCHNLYFNDSDSPLVKEHPRGSANVHTIDVGTNTSIIETPRPSTEKSTSPLHSSRICYDSDTSRRSRRATYCHVSTATDSIVHDATVKSCQTSPRSAQLECDASRQEGAVSSEKEAVGSEKKVESARKECVLATSYDTATPIKNIADHGGLECNVDQVVEVDLTSDDECKEVDNKSNNLHEAQTIENTPQFSARIGVECALHLQSSLNNSTSSVVFVSCHPCEISNSSKEVESCEVKSMYVSPEVSYRSDPEWCWNCDIQLPADLLISSVKRLVFKVWERKDSISEDETKSSNLIGFAAVDLTVLAAGLPLVSGWYNIIDFAGMCRGQIKLLVDPCEDLSRFHNLTHEYISNPSKSSSSSMYLAHCAYPEFPSHVVHHSDMRVHLLEPQSTNSDMSTLLSRYQLLLQCRRKANEDLLTDQEPFSNNTPGTQAKPDCKLDSRRVDDKPSNDRVTGSKNFEDLPVNSLSGSQALSEHEEEDPSVCLRKKMSELDILTKIMKTKLMANAESHLSNQSFAAYLLPSNDVITVQEDACDRNGNKSYPLNTPSNFEGACSEMEECTTNYRNCLNFKDEDKKTEHIMPEDNRKGSRELSSAPSCSYAYKEAEGDKFYHVTHVYGQSYSRANTERELSHQSNLEFKAQGSNSNKPRKTWEKQEELIDLRSLEIDCKDDEEGTAEIEEVAEWLRNSAVHHIFNPVLFHDLMNELSPATSSVKVIELDDDSNNEINDCPSSDEARKAVWSSDCSDERSGIHHSGDHLRGDETYRKNVFQCFSSDGQHNSGKPVTAADTGFHSTVAAGTRKTAAQRVGSGGVISSRGGMSSASSSGVSTLHHSPFGSPERRRPGVPESQLI